MNTHQNNKIYDTLLLSRVKVVMQLARNYLVDPASTNHIGHEVQFAFYQEGNKFNSMAKESNMTLVVREDIIDTSNVPLDQDISDFEWNDLEKQQVNKNMLAQYQLSSNKKRCIATSGKGLKARQCSSYPVKGAELCKRHDK